MHSDGALTTFSGRLFYCSVTGLPQKNIIQIPGLSRTFQDIFLVFPGLWPALFQDFSRTFHQNQFQVFQVEWPPWNIGMLPKDNIYYSSNLYVFYVTWKHFIK